MQSWLTQATWQVAKDVILTFGGLALIMSEVFWLRPISDVVLITGLAMTGLGASFHLGAIISGFVGRSGSPSPPPPGSSGSSR